jgi:hypothetical protein
MNCKTLKHAISRVYSHILPPSLNLRRQVFHLYKTTLISYFDTLNDTLYTVQQTGVNLEQNGSEDTAEFGCS